MKAIDIFSELIKYFKESLLDDINLSIAEGKLSISNMDFVLAVPASCGEGAKIFMREAAKKVILFLGHKAFQEYKIRRFMSILDKAFT